MLYDSEMFDDLSGIFHGTFLIQMSGVMKQVFMLLKITVGEIVVVWNIIFSEQFLCRGVDSRRCCIKPGREKHNQWNVVVPTGDDEFLKVGEFHLVLFHGRHILFFHVVWHGSRLWFKSLLRLVVSRKIVFQQIYKVGIILIQALVVLYVFRIRKFLEIIPDAGVAAIGLQQIQITLVITTTQVEVILHVVDNHLRFIAVQHIAQSAVLENDALRMKSAVIAGHPQGIFDNLRHIVVDGT